MTEVANKWPWETHSGNPDSKEGLSLDSTPAVRRTSFHLIHNISSFTFMKWCVNFHFVQTKFVVYVREELPLSPHGKQRLRVRRRLIL
jgi:hypothetical protein